jgi:hypothetical protein
LSEQSQRSGVVASGALHGALLLAILVGFSSAPKFDDAAESVPVETITQDQYNQIMKGERDAKPAKPVENQGQPPTVAAPTPPVEPPKSEPPPKKVEETRDQTPPAAPTPPARPTPPIHEAAAQPTPPPPDDAEIDRPQARVDRQTPPTPPEPPQRPKADDRPKPDQLAKLLEDPKPDDQPKPPARPKSADTPTETKRAFDINSIAKLLEQSKPSKNEQVASTTPLGSPTQNMQHMSPSLSAAIDGWLTDAYLRCWQPPPTMPEGAKYVAEIKVAFNADGSLSARPLLVNPPSDPAWRAYAESAMRAVLKCNPLQVPPQYIPYFEQWKNKTVHFDPENALG